MVYITSSQMAIAIDGKNAALICGRQKIDFLYSDGHYALFTYVRKNGEWIAFFDKGESLIQGGSFGCHPDAMEVLEAGSKRIEVRFTGRNTKEQYDFEWLVEAKSSSSLIHFTIINHLSRPLVMEGFEPRIMLWRRDPPKNPITLRQELPNYNTTGDEFYWKNGMPAAYLYTEGVESAIFFDMAPMTWYSMKPDGINRFLSSQTRVVDENASTGLGLDLRRESRGKR
ncbi:MAG: hypothetical protein ACYC5K_10750, partial [Saccharofermentanales bacterium]